MRQEGHPTGGWKGCGERALGTAWQRWGLTGVSKEEESPGWRRTPEGGGGRPGRGFAFAELWRSQQCFVQSVAETKNYEHQSGKTDRVEQAWTVTVGYCFMTNHLNTQQLKIVNFYDHSRVNTSAGKFCWSGPGLSHLDWACSWVSWVEVLVLDGLTCTLAVCRLSAGCPDDVLLIIQQASWSLYTQWCQKESGNTYDHLKPRFGIGMPSLLPHVISQSKSQDRFIPGTETSLDGRCCKVLLQRTQI